MVAYRSQERAMDRKCPRVSLVVFPECDPSILFGVFDTLWAAGQFWDTFKGLPPGAPLFEPRLVAAEKGEIRMATGVSIVAQDGIADVPDTDIVFIPNVIIGSAQELRNLDRSLLAWIRKAYENGSHIYSACAGSLVLAEAGLLDDGEATTHWGYANLFRQEYPKVKLHPERILVQTGDQQRIVSGGGASSWQDLALFMVMKHAGPEEAMRLSKIFLYQWHRDGQLPYSCMMQNVTHQDRVIGEQQVWIAENYARPNLVTELVRRSGLPERTFNRRFKAATGFTPIAYVQALRVEEAKQMLETSDLSVEQVAREVGYDDNAYFRHLFRRLCGVTPADYRRKLQFPPSVKQAMGHGTIAAGDSSEAAQRI
jgi:transcriptional regulator GlxA family with amidase domain